MTFICRTNYTPGRPGPSFVFDVVAVSFDEFFESCYELLHPLVVPPPTGETGSPPPLLPRRSPSASVLNVF